MVMTECWRCLLLDVQDGEKVLYRGSKCRRSRIEAPKCILETAQVRQRELQGRVSGQIKKMEKSVEESCGEPGTWMEVGYS